MVYVIRRQEQTLERFLTAMGHGDTVALAARLETWLKSPENMEVCFEQDACDGHGSCTLSVIVHSEVRFDLEGQLENILPLSPKIAPDVVIWTEAC